jgi:hypothetical protein
MGARAVHPGKLKQSARIIDHGDADLHVLLPRGFQASGCHGLSVLK